MTLIFTATATCLLQVQAWIAMSGSKDNLDQARRALRESFLNDLRTLDVEQAGDSLVISGRVNSFYHKQMAQEIVRAVCEGVELHNTVDVARRTD